MMSTGRVPLSSPHAAAGRNPYCDSSCTYLVGRTSFRYPQIVCCCSKGAYPCTNVSARFSCRHVSARFSAPLFAGAILGQVHHLLRSGLDSHGYRIDKPKTKRETLCTLHSMLYLTGVLPFNAQHTPQGRAGFTVRHRSERCSHDRRYEDFLYLSRLGKTSLVPYRQSLTF